MLLDSLKPRVCILTSVHPPFDKRVFRREACTLAKAGYEVILVAPHDREEVVDDVRIWPVTPSRNRFLRILRTMHVFHLALVSRADIFHFHDPELLLTGLLLKWVTKKPVIYDVHEYNALAILTKHWIPRILRKGLSVIMERVEKGIARQLSEVIVVTDHMADQFRTKNTSVTTIFNYPIITDGIAESSDTETRRKLQREVIYLGTISKERGLETMLETIPKIRAEDPKVRFLLVGQMNLRGISNEGVRRLQQYIEDGCVEAPGEIPFVQAVEYLRRASIGWIPCLPTRSLVKGIPVKLYEYALYAKPVIASNIGLLAELVNEMGCGLLVDPDDPDSHAEAIAYLFDHPREAKRMGQKGREAVLERFNWDTEEKKLLALYAQLCRKEVDQTDQVT